MVKEFLKVENLMNTYYDDANQKYTLEFQKDGKSYFIEVNAKDHEEAKNNEYYFDDEKTIANILKDIIDEDIEIKRR